MSKLLSLLLTAALVWAVGVVPTSANTPTKPSGVTTDGTASPESRPGAAGRPAGEVKTAVLKLVADAKADRRVRTPAPQFPKPQRNNLSTGQKVAIGAGIAVAALVIAYFVIRANCDGICEK